MDELALDVLIGPTWVADVSGTHSVTASLLAEAGIPSDTVRLLLRTEQEPRAPAAGFSPDFAALTADGAAWVLAQQIRLVGIDSPSIDLYDLGPDSPVHRALLGAGVIVVENLLLSGVREGSYQLICLPLPIGAGDGAPARAILIQGAAEL